MILIDEKTISPQVIVLLNYVTSKEKVRMEYSCYLEMPNRMLYGMVIENDIVGCIGINIVSSSNCEIRHIAVNPNFRKCQIGRNMILFIIEKLQLASIFAETDKEAVDFYASIGFTIKSLGEKYPGVERFYCEFEKERFL